jgi:uncharacterized repeat protein (TIGR03843 family)
VPLTLAREDGPAGEGSLQLFVPAAFDQNYFTFSEDPAHRDRLERICAFDLIANNADRKAGHCLLGEDGRVWAIDNALTFNVDPKLRTVIWQYGGEPIPEPLLADLRRLVGRGLPAPLGALLEPDEADLLVKRARRLLKGGKFPDDPGGRSYPWPLV